ncbi:MAG: ABC transporter permease [Chloroflexi bacterium]|nr:ABC transporter permease [Chloroflexota bacterium]PKB58413.1 MAG: peptide ABC transporter permease [SAR202 cluster bacterium Casp-Chloro-G2]
MLRYTAQRLFWMFPVLFGIGTITFVLMHAVPGGPWDENKKLPPHVVANLNNRYDLYDSLLVQYGKFLGNTVRGDLGVSYINQDRDVADVIRQGLPATLTLAGLAFLISVAGGIPLGVMAAGRRNKTVDVLSIALATVFASVPGFILGILLVMTFSVAWDLLPSGGWGSPSHVVLPALALALLPMAFIARITRASVLEVLDEDYVRTAEAKGMPPLVVQYRHVLRNALVPIITIIGAEAGALLTGSFIIETIFSVPGIGRLFVQGVMQRDYGLVTGLVLFYATVMTVVNLIADLLYASVEPRIRFT